MGNPFRTWCLGAVLGIGIVWSASGSVSAQVDARYLEAEGQSGLRQSLGALEQSRSALIEARRAIDAALLDVETALERLRAEDVREAFAEPAPRVEALPPVPGDSMTRGLTAVGEAWSGFCGEAASAARAWIDGSSRWIGELGRVDLAVEVEATAEHPSETYVESLGSASSMPWDSDWLLAPSGAGTAVVEVEMPTATEADLHGSAAGESIAAESAPEAAIPPPVEALQESAAEVETVEPTPVPPPWTPRIPVLDDFEPAPWERPNAIRGSDADARGTSLPAIDSMGMEVTNP
jgi:hypothetical protein